MHPTLKIALLGYGLAGRHFHRPLIQATTGLEITAVVTAHPARREQVASDLPAAQNFRSADEVWATSANFDLVVVAGANITHLPNTLGALAHGLHAVVDKPLAATADQATAISIAARAAGRQVFPFQNRRWDSDFLTVLANRDAIGRIHRFESHFERFRRIPKGGWREEVDPKAAGGVLIDFGAHLVDQAIELLGPVIRVTAKARSIREIDAADDDMQILLDHENGAVSYLTGSKVAAFSEPRFTVLGTTGGLLVSTYDTQEKALRAGRTPTDADWGVEPLESAAVLRVALADGGTHDTEVPLVPGRWSDFYPGVFEAITNHVPPPVLIGDAIANLRVLDAARLAAGTGQSISLDPPAGHE